MSRRVALLSLLTLFLPGVVLAQPEGAAGEPRPPVTVLPHNPESWWSVGGQINVITQWHGVFTSPYSGENSLRAEDEVATSRVMTLSLRVRPLPRTDVSLDIESAGGRGISDALGLAGFTNLDVVRNPELGPAPYLARLVLHQIMPLGRADAASGSAASALEFSIGKLSTADYFDRNAVGSDSHLQFANWTIDNNGAYDYAADTRGYTWGALVEYHAPRWAVRFGEMLMPKVANGLVLDWDLGRARSENVEVTVAPALLRGRRATIRLLGYANHANMGDYREALARATAGASPLPVIEDTRQQGRIKYGVGVGVEQPVTDGVRLFGRWGVNEPHFESFAYTEVNNSATIGGDSTLAQWHRRLDRIGLALVSSGLSDDHRAYLAHGGRGFLLGDGALTYGRETIAEAYYNAHLWRGVFAAADLQRIVNPGYNRDRGPVTVYGLRLHVEF